MHAPTGRSHKTTESEFPKATRKLSKPHRSKQAGLKKQSDAQDTLDPWLRFFFACVRGGEEEREGASNLMRVSTEGERA